MSNSYNSLGRCDSICDAASYGTGPRSSCFTPWCKCVCHATARAAKYADEQKHGQEAEPVSADDNAPEQAREVEVVARALCLEAGENPDLWSDMNVRRVYGWESFIDQARAILAALAPIRAAERQEAARELTDAWCDWLAAIGFGIDFGTALPPPCSAKDLAEAMQREDPSESIDIWAACVEDNTGQRFGPDRADGVTGRSGT